MSFQVSVPYHQHDPQLDIPDDVVWTAESDDPKKDDIGEAMGVTSVGRDTAAVTCTASLPDGTQTTFEMLHNPTTGKFIGRMELRDKSRRRAMGWQPRDLEIK